MTYHLGQAPPASSLPSDVAPTLLQELSSPRRERGWVAVPTVDMREYVKTQLITMAAGFVIGVSVGAVLGNVFSGKKVSARDLIPNTKALPRRTTKRRSTARGRKSVVPVPKDELTLRLDGSLVQVTVDRGHVAVAGIGGVGTVYDGYSYFRAVPWGTAEVRDFERLADAVKYLIRARPMTRNARHAPPVTKAEARSFVRKYGADELKWLAEAWTAAKQDNWGKPPRLSTPGWWRTQVKGSATKLVYGHFKHPMQTEPVEFADDYWEPDQVIAQVMLVLHDMARKGNR